MKPLQILKHIKSKNYYYINKIINCNISRFFRFIAPFLFVSLFCIILLFISSNMYIYKPQQSDNIEILSKKLLKLHKEKDEVRTVINEGYVDYYVKGKFDVYNYKNEKINTVVLDNKNVIDTYNINTIKKEKNGEISLIGETKEKLNVVLSCLLGPLIVIMCYFSVFFIGDLIIFIINLFKIKPFYDWSIVKSVKIDSLWTSLFYIPDYNPKYHYIPATYYLWFYIKEFFGYKLTENDIYYLFISGNYDFERTYLQIKTDEEKYGTNL